ncbi:MAG: ATP-dependent helicase [Syntrophomonadaceae bacterium]|nr:ATP-dependent helicase [Syntrophomonadaceae bacterium]
MFKNLSLQQQEIVFHKHGCFAVRACPGSGKTFTVAARLAYRMDNWHLNHQGIAALSFTNVACAEIAKKLETSFASPLRYPHFLGTIDSFINQFIFLPFGHLIMNCSSRPVLVGEPHGRWSAYMKHDYDYVQYFDKTSYDVEDNLIQTVDASLFHFRWKPTNRDGSENGNITRIKTIKKICWEKGYATQQDADYVAMKVLEKYPHIAKALVYRFPELIIDEAQDTSEIQMRIIDLLMDNGLKDVMLVGDPDQAIFEWRQAKPELFNGKFRAWERNSTILSENWRSSQSICNCTYTLSEKWTSPCTAVNPSVSEFGLRPRIITYSKDSVSVAIKDFLNLCQKHGVTVSPEQVAVLYRSRSFASSVNGVPALDHKRQPWLPSSLVTRDFAEAKYKYTYDSSEHKEGLRKIERALYKYILGKEFCSTRELRELTDKMGYVHWRNMVFRFVNTLPTPENSLAQWIKAVNTSPDVLRCYRKILISMEHMGIKTQMKKFALSVDESRANVSFAELFAGELPVDPGVSYRFGTVHSVKGETFDAVLLFLTSKAGKHSKYARLLNAEPKELKDKEKEEIRIVYVAITRPRKILVLAVPSVEDKDIWEKKLLL